MDVLPGADQQAERMSGRVREDEQRLPLVVSAVVEQRGTEVLGTLPLAHQFLHVWYPEVVMHLLRHIVSGPVGSGQRRDLLDGEDTTSRLVHQHQPVGIVVATVRGDFIARPVLETKELAVELCKTSAIGGVNGCVHQGGVVSHSNSMRARLVLLSQATHLGNVTSAHRQVTDFLMGIVRVLERSAMPYTERCQHAVMPRVAVFAMIR